MESHEYDYLFKFMNGLNEEERNALVEQFNSIDFEKILQQFHESKMSHHYNADSLNFIENDRHTVRAKLSEDKLSSLWNRALEAIAEGKVAAIVLAGGQASRLGATKPKGVLNLGITEMHGCDSLFGLQASRISRLQDLARLRFPSSKPIIQWIVMTSASTESDTRKYLSDIIEQCGLSMDQVTIFSQGELPCLTHDEKLMLASKSRIATAPNGNGGIYEAIAPYLCKFRSLGVRYFHVYCVDNVLCRVADPHFLGYCIENNADCTAKVIEKLDPYEGLGVVCRENGRVKVVEYSEIPTELAEARNESGQLSYRAGSIANHFFTLEFLERVCRDDCRLMYHIASKKIPFVDEYGNYIKPTAENGYKLEKFVFDVFEYSKNFYLWEVSRSEEFSPLKNPNSAGKDCLATCIRDLYAEWCRWTHSAGDSTPFVHPRLCYAGEGIEALLNPHAQHKV